MELKLIDLVSADFFSQDAGIPPWKRIVDSLVILATLPVVVPVVLLIALAIKLVSRGPVLFRQERIGYYGQPFTIYKFRTMHVNAPTSTHQEHLNDLMKSSKPMTKMDLNDTRVIRGGGILRATGLDELPQLINVLRGEMSVVGPRPCTAYEYEQYSPYHSRRLEALPGLTGLWQVSGKNRLSFEQMIQLDIHYAEHTSVWLDLKIMLRTFPVLFSQLREAVVKRLPGRRVRDQIGTPQLATALSVERAAHADSLDSLSHRSVRSRKDKKCQTRLVLESSDVDTGVRT
jgi:lipopolysaccharide/colanic/teichoic acid biosynthesis glycosyltransferase